ncbi:MAG: hypothetical protein D6732_28085 [Methanobacteriota archaeon]|nr:MAG: hypothetical protein D6732_28085 [Euryarchaeota archaeon]
MSRQVMFCFILLLFFISHGQYSIRTHATPEKISKEENIFPFNKQTYVTNFTFGSVIVSDQPQLSITEREFLVDYSLSEEHQVFDVLPINSTHLFFNILKDNSLYLLDKETGNAIEYQFPTGITPFKLKMANDGSIWLTDYTYKFNDTDTHIVHFFPNNLTYHSYRINGGSVAPFDLLVDEDRIWFSLWLGNSIGYLKPEKKEITIIDIVCAETCGPLGLVKDHEGKIWFVESYTNLLVRYAPETGAIIKYPVDPDFIAPVGVVIDGNGKLWSGSHGGDLIVQFDPDTASVNRKYYVPKPENNIILAGINDLHIDRLQRVWAVEHFKDSVAVLDHDTIIEYRTEGDEPTAQFGKLSGNDFWFAQFKYGIISVVPENKQVDIEITLKSNTINFQKGRSATVELEITYLSGPVPLLELTPFADAVGSQLIHGSQQNEKLILKQGETTSYSLKVEVSSNVKISQYHGIVGFANQNLRIFANVNLVITENFFQTLIFNNLGGYLLFATYVVLKRKPWKSSGN